MSSHFRSLIEIDFESGRGLVGVDGLRLRVATHRLTHFVARVGVLYQFVGELAVECSSDKPATVSERAPSMFKLKVDQRPNTARRRPV